MKPKDPIEQIEEAVLPVASKAIDAMVGEHYDGMRAYKEHKDLGWALGYNARVSEEKKLAEKLKLKLKIK